MAFRVWSHICEYAMIGDNGKVSIIGEFDRIITPKIPSLMRFFFVVSKWSGNDKEQFVYRVRITAPSKTVAVESKNHTVAIAGTNDGIGDYLALNRFFNVNFSEVGEYAVEFLLNDFGVHYQPLFIIQQ